MIGMLQDDARDLIDSIIQLAYFMRGGITFSELMNITSGVRDRIENFIKQRLESESKGPRPNY